MNQVLKDIQLIKLLQNEIVQWLNFCGIISYSKLYKGCNTLISQALYPNNQEPNVSFYNIVFPLIKTGVIEYGTTERKGTFFFLPNNDEHSSFFVRSIDNPARLLINTNNKENLTIAGINMLRSLPSIKNYVKSITTTTIYSEFEFMYDEYKMQLKKINTTFNREVGIYKQKDLIYFPYFIADKDGLIHELNSYHRNLEAMDYAHSYVLAAQGKNLYEYNKEHKSFRFLYQKYVPIFIFRAMCLIDPEILYDENIYIGNNVTFHFDDNGITKELNRIFKVS